MNVVFIGQLVRKLLAAALGAWMLALVNAGVLTQGTADQWLEATGAIVAFLLVTFWSNWVFPWFKSKLQK